MHYIWEINSERRWFDRDGSTSRELFLVAVLQNGAVVTREAILLVRTCWIAPSQELMVIQDRK